MASRTAAAALVFGLAASVAAQSTVSVFLPDADASQTLDASVIAVNDGLTTMQIFCAPGTPSDECGYYAPFTAIAGPSTVHVVETFEDNETIDYACQLTGTTSAVCSATYSGLASDFDTYTGSAPHTPPTGSTVVVSTMTLAADEITLIPVTVTAGAGVSGASTASSTGSQATSASRSGSGASSTVTATTSSRTSGSSSSTTSTSTSTVSRAGAANVAAYAPGVAAGAMGLAAFLL